MAKRKSKKSGIKSVKSTRARTTKRKATTKRSGASFYVDDVRPLID